MGGLAAKAGGVDEAGSARGGAGKARLLRQFVSSVRRVRLFARRSHEDPVWREQVSWMRAASVEAVNGALAAIKPYSQHPHLRKEPYGGKAKGILEQYEKYVPRCFVPDKYAVGVGGHSGVAAGAWQRFGLGYGDSPSQQPCQPGRGNGGGRAASECVEETVSPAALPGVADSSATVSRMPWVRALHAAALVDILLGAPFLEKLPKKYDGWLLLASKMPVLGGFYWEEDTLKRHAKALAAQRGDIQK